MKSYVIIKYNKESEKYGKVLRVDSYDEEKITKDDVKEKILKWGNNKDKPILIEDPLMIEIMESLEYREKAASDPLQDIRNSIESIIDDLQDLL